ncbi:MAG: alanine--tRNA ligase [Chloroflexi bacterium]|nr:alanine--tRNA ligase [Chloroflexota bacterium]MQC27060.1 alanine--tRNA ligase [Chloroflexota bacterium]
MANPMSGSEIRQSFIDFFAEKHKHIVVPSSSLVPASDATLLFTNSGMVQFVDVFLGTGKRPYKRAVNSQKCIRVAGKHNDLEDVGTDDTHHTFFEMLGSWSFGDYYKREAIDWAWELLTVVWGLPKERLYVSVFKDDQGDIPTDEEAAEAWRTQPGLAPDHIVYLGRKDNFWEMADTGPSGPNSEIHLDLGEDKGELSYLENGQVDLDGPRFVELWNLVFIQYNRRSETDLEPLPSKHVDTGMGFERIVAVLQGEDSNYHTDLFQPLIDKVQTLTGHSDSEVAEKFTPYRVIADHARAAAFLIADGVVPGNMGRNYITRMIIRRAARFGGKIGLNEPFLAQVAEELIKQYGEAYPELTQNRANILENLTREEERFQRTVEGGLAQLEVLFAEMEKSKSKILEGGQAFDLYATYGLPLEIARDIAREHGLDVDDAGFTAAMDVHREASGAGQGMGELGGEEAGVYREILEEFQKAKKLGSEGVIYEPYAETYTEGEVLALVRDGKAVESAKKGDKVAVLLPRTPFYVASGGQISDTGVIRGAGWEIRVEDTAKPAAGVVVHLGEVVSGTPKVGEPARAEVDSRRRQDIMRNHTATHLLHAALHEVLGAGALQAGSLVAPDRLRFDFNHAEAMTQEQKQKVEDLVNGWVLDNYALKIETKGLEQARKEGAIALFGEKYSENVRTIQIGGEPPFSYELCGGTHVERTGDIGTFLITSEGSVAAGIRRIEAVTGREAYARVRSLGATLDEAARALKSASEKVPYRVKALQKELGEAQKALAAQRRNQASEQLDSVLDDVPEVAGVPVLTAKLEGADIEALRSMADRFRQKYTSGVALLAGGENGKPSLIATVTKDLIERGLHAGELVKLAAEPLGGSGGGRADIAQAGGKDSSKVDEALAVAAEWVKQKLG